MCCRKNFVTHAPEKGQAKWWFHSNADSMNLCANNRCLDSAEKGVALPQLTYPLNLKGKYAIFIHNPLPFSEIELRLSGDERSQLFGGGGYGREQFFKYAKMDYQNIIIAQSHRALSLFEDNFRARLDYIKLVPLDDKLAFQLENRFQGERDKLVIGYNEPYSWAFYNNVQKCSQHREPLLAFQEVELDIVDIQIGRLGARPFFESRNEEPLFWSTKGDPVRGKIPKTDNVGRMQQYTNSLQCQLRYAREMGITPFANIGAANSYRGTPLQGDFSKCHPDWHNGNQLRYNIPEVREHMLNFYKEALEIGAEGISIDFCRYPGGIDQPETANQFFRKLRSLADEYSKKRSKRVPILVRFPAIGVKHADKFDYETWCKEGLVDYLCPSNISGRPLNFSMTHYIKAVKGTNTILCPVVDALHWGLRKPGGLLWRVKKLYDQGIKGIYIYQCDAPVVFGNFMTREMVRLCGSTTALENYFNMEANETPDRSKDIYISRSFKGELYQPSERIHIWTDGIEPAELHVYVDGTLTNKFDSPPYWVGDETEDYDLDFALTGKHTIKIRARDGGNWLEKFFEVEGRKSKLEK